MTDKRTYNLGRRAETAAETRQRLVEATAALHAERGISATSLPDIAERAPVSVGTAYHHFPTYLDALRAFAAGAPLSGAPPPTPPPPRPPPPPAPGAPTPAPPRPARGSPSQRGPTTPLATRAYSSSGASSARGTSAPRGAGAPPRSGRRTRR